MDLVSYKLHYAESYRPFELFANANYKLQNDLKLM